VGLYKWLNDLYFAPLGEDRPASGGRLISGNIQPRKMLAERSVLTDAEKHRRVIRERKKREKRQRGAVILEAAQKLFFAKGYAKATMDEIALAAEISKPTIYQYFKNKDHLYFSLMIPFIEEIGRHFKKIEDKLQAGRYRTGKRLIRDLFQVSLTSYESTPEVFQIIQIFQQTGLVGELDPEFSSVLDEKGRANFQSLRRIVDLGQERGLLKKVKIYELADIFWGLFVGIVQLEERKSRGKKESPYLRSTLKLAERILAEAVARPSIKSKGGDS